jgi:hypothetical protein
MKSCIFVVAGLVLAYVIVALTVFVMYGLIPFLLGG